MKYCPQQFGTHEPSLGFSYAYCTTTCTSIAIWHCIGASVYTVSVHSTVAEIGGLVSNRSMDALSTTEL